MRSYGEMVGEFHAAAGLPERPTPGWDEANHYLRVGLHEEEWKELGEAIEARDLEGTAKELADLIYVLVGTARTFGIPIDAVFAEVHRSNMSKVTGEIRRRDDGKILKPDTYSPADVRRVMWPAVPPRDHDWPRRDERCVNCGSTE